jgi:D-alanine transaminase
VTTAYLNGDYLPLEQARISPLDRGFLYGDGVYEVVHAYRGLPFRLDAHVARLRRSLGELRIAADPGLLTAIVTELIATDALGDALLYLQITRGAPPKRQHAFPPADTPPTVFAFGWPYQPMAEWYDPGLVLTTLPDDRWTRCDIKTTALVANVMGHQRAREAGAHEGVFVRDGAVTEGTLSNVFAVFAGEVRTAPLSNLILPGVKRDVVLACCAEAGIPARLEPILAHELPQADEVFITSTVHDVARARRVDGRDLPQAHPVTDRLRRMFRDAVKKECGL